MKTLIQFIITFSLLIFFQDIDAQVVVYQNANFQGNYVNLKIGKYPVNRLRGVGDNQISSIKVPNGYEVMLYDHPNFSRRARSLKVTGNVANLATKRFDNLTSSIYIVKKRGSSSAARASTPARSRTYSKKGSSKSKASPNNNTSSVSPSVTIGNNPAIVKSLLPHIDITFVPEESGAIVFQELAPIAKGHSIQGQLSIKMYIKNKGSKDLQLTKVELINSQANRSWSVATSNKKNINPIAPGKSYSWQNGRGYNEMGNVILLNTPFPTTQTIKLHFKGFNTPIVINKPLKPYTGSTLEFPGRSEELAVNEYWSGHTLHGSGGSQVFGLDLGVSAWDGNNWTELHKGTNGSKNSDYRCYGKPIYAMADGKVLSFKNDHPDNAKPGVREYENVEGNNFWIDHGELVVAYAHFIPGSLNPKLMKKGAIVKKGDFLGLTGNSGNSSHPHLHLHVTTGNKTWSGDFRPMRITGAEIVATSQMTSPSITNKWTKLNKRNLPSVMTLIRPTTSQRWAEYTRHGLRGKYFQGEFDKIAKAGYYPEWINGYEVGSTTYYNAIFRPSNGKKWVARHGLTGAGFQKEFDKWTKAGYRPISLDSYVINGRSRYAVVFMKMSGPAYKVYHGTDQGTHQNRFNSWTKQGWTPTKVSMVRIGSKNYFTAIYEHKNVGGFYHLGGLTAAQYQSHYNEKAKKGFQPVYIDVYMAGSTPKFSVIWYKKPPFKSHVARHGQNAKSFQQSFDQNLKSGNLTRCIAGYQSGGKAYFASIWTKKANIIYNYSAFSLKKN